MFIPVPVILGFDRMFSVHGFVFFAILVGALLTGLGFVMAFVVMIRTGEDRTGVVLPITSISVAVVRNGKTATLGYQPDVWKEWK